MATGIIGALQGAGTIVYQPTTNAKVVINYSGSTGAVLNGAAVISGNTVGTGGVYLWVGAGQTMTLTQTGGSSIVSCIEG